MSKIVDGFLEGYNGKIKIEWESETVENSGNQIPNIDLSNPVTISVQNTDENLGWPETIQVSTETLNSIGIFPQLNCTVCMKARVPYSVSPDIWTVTPDPGTNTFKLEISAKKQGNEWTDPKATVTVGEPPN